MNSYKPNTPYNVTAILKTPKITTVKGVKKKDYEESFPFSCSVKTFGGTETTVNGITVVENTAIIECWYNSEIKADCVIELDGVDYEILGVPENINMRCQYMRFKVRAIKGGA